MYIIIGHRYNNKSSAKFKLPQHPKLNPMQPPTFTENMQ